MPQLPKMQSYHPEMANLRDEETATALSALCGCMLLLGIVIHSAVTFGTLDYAPAWGLKDARTNTAFDWMVGAINCFRMPVFFLASGYFGSMMLSTKGSKSMLMNRFKRIVLPFTAGILLVWPLSVAAFAFAGGAIHHTQSPWMEATRVFTSVQFLPFNVGHLWFLYFLALHHLLAFVMERMLAGQTRLTQLLHRVFRGTIKTFWFRLFALAAALFLCLYWMGTPYLRTNNRWAIQPAIFTTYFMLFGTGWLLHKTNCIQHLKSHPLLQLCAGVSLYWLAGSMVWPVEAWVPLAKKSLSALYSTLFILGFLAFFLSYARNPSMRFRYIMDSSYWMYIVHLPVVVLLPGLMADLDLPAVVKFSLTALGTTALCFASYRLFVRGKWVVQIWGKWQ